ncbi:MAG: DsrE family protein [Nitrososphaerales archaeon]|nr:DsrE family protein [Nitrososphaerales archaeon]
MTDKKYLFVVSTGANEPKKAFSPFYYANASSAMGFDTTMFFLAEGPTLIRKGAAENIRTTEDGEPLKKVIDISLHSGVKLLCCSTAAKVIWKMKDEDLLDGAVFAGSATLLEMAADPETAVLYF